MRHAHIHNIRETCVLMKNTSLTNVYYFIAITLGHRQIKDSFLASCYNK